MTTTTDENSFKLISFLFCSLAALLSPIQPLVLITFLFIAIDTFIGIYKAYRIGDEITSKKASAVIGKIIFYSLGIFSVYLLEEFIIDELFNSPMLLTKFTTFIFCFIEIKSIDENIKIVNLGKGIIYYIETTTAFLTELKDRINRLFRKPME